MSDLHDFFEKGIMGELFWTEYNFHIYKKIGLAHQDISKSGEQKAKLLGFVQLSAITNFTLHICKIYEKSGENTRSLFSFLNIMNKRKGEFPPIIEIHTTGNLLKQYRLPEYFLGAMTDSDTTLFPMLFSEYYLTKYNSSEVQSDIIKMKAIRDKVIAHNDIKGDGLLGDSTAVETLMEFATEIVEVYSMAYQHRLWSRSIKHQADQESYFIDSEIRRLKENKTV